MARATKKTSVETAPAPVETLTPPVQVEAEPAQFELVKMVRIVDGKQADVHPSEVNNWKSGGWIEE